MLCRQNSKREVKKIELHAENDAKQRLLEKLDQGLLNHAKSLSAGDDPQIVDVYRLQGLAELHYYLKAIHQFNPAEVEGLLQFADPLQAAYLCWEENDHEFSFPICDLLKETGAKDCLPLAEPEQPKKLSLKEQLNAAMKEVRQHPPREDKAHGGDAR